MKTASVICSLLVVGFLGAGTAVASGEKGATGLTAEEVAGFCSAVGCGGGPRACATFEIHIGPPAIPTTIEIVCEEP